MTVPGESRRTVQVVEIPFPEASALPLVAAVRLNLVETAASEPETDILQYFPELTIIGVGALSMLRQRQIHRKVKTQSHGSSLPPSSLRSLPEGP